MRSSIIVKTLLLLCSWASLAQADIVIGFNADATLTELNVTVGQAFSVDLYYVETDTSLAATDGLFSFGTRGTFSPAVIQFTGGDVDPAFPAGIDPNPTSPVAGTVEVFGGANSPPKASSIHLTTLNFLATGVGSTVLSFGDLDPDFDDFSIDGFATEIDPLIFAPAHLTHNLTINVSAVPEPSSLLLASLTSLSGLTFHFRRRYRKATKHSALALIGKS